MEDLKIAIGGQAHFFGIDIQADFEHVHGKDVLVVHEQPGSPTEITVDSIADEIQNMLAQFDHKATKPTVTPSWPPGVGDVVKSLTIVVHEIYLRVIKDTAGTAFDYALWLGVESSSTLKNKFPITLDSLWLKVWKTDNPVILKEMNISSIGDLFPKAIPAT